jgi:hypothetical protein
MQNKTTTQHIDDEITLRDIIFNAGIYFKEVLKYWLIVFLVTIPLIAYFGYMAYYDKPHFEAKLTYTLNDGSGKGGLAGLLGTMGLGGDDKANFSQIIEVSKSRKLTNNILFSKIALDSVGVQEDYVANHIIELYNLKEFWSKRSPTIAEVKFKSSEIENFNRLELTALKSVYSIFMGGFKNHPPLYVPSFNKDNGILTIFSSTLNEHLSFFISNKGYQEVRKYYIGAKTSTPGKSLKFVEQKKDSISNLLKSKQLQLARFNDSHRNLVDPDLLTEKKMMETDIQKLMLMYGEVTKNYELADFSLASSEPQMQIIDEPILPLDAKQLMLLLELFKGAILGIIISITFIIVRKIFRDAMSV